MKRALIGHTGFVGSTLARTEPFDASRVVVRAGVAPGERVVVRGAGLVNQVR